jgi:hypothetical protein
MGDVVNLNRARKARARVEDKARAAQNRSRFGQTKADEARRQAERRLAETRLDEARREPVTESKPDAS